LALVKLSAGGIGRWIITGGSEVLNHIIFVATKAVPTLQSMIPG
jgi:hypothetical protein